MSAPHLLAPGATIGILGDGQLGRMTALAAARLGYRTHIFGPEADAPATQVTPLVTRAGYDDLAALADFAAAVDVVTLEFENIPVASLQWLAERVPVLPGPGTLAVTQHRVREKQFAQSVGAGTAPFRAIESLDSLRHALTEIGAPAVLKTCRFGYDGKGQVKIAEPAAAAQAWEQIGRSGDCILEGFVDFACEVSVIVARGVDGSMAAFPVVENRHKHHILDETHAPALLAPVVLAEAERVALSLAAGLPDLVGLLAVELFVTADGQVLVNEMAPRPHNSGHWTMDGCATDQFEQLVRAVCGLPLGSTAIRAPTVMKNLIGDDVAGWASWLADPRARLHLYGKATARPGRKMGHVNILGN
jgi:5-(carboxyamino)imidazole ribonucleotide synthase